MLIKRLLDIEYCLADAHSVLGSSNGQRSILMVAFRHLGMAFRWYSFVYENDVSSWQRYG